MSTDLSELWRGEVIIEAFEPYNAFGIGIRIAVRMPNGDVHPAQPLVFVRHEPGLEAPPCMIMANEDCAKLAAALERVKVRLPGQESTDTQSSRISDLRERVNDLKADKDMLLAVVRDFAVKQLHPGGATSL